MFSSLTFIGPTAMDSSSNRDRRKNRWWAVSVNLAALISRDVKLNEARDRAAARPLEEESGGGVLGGDDATWLDEIYVLSVLLIELVRPSLGGCRRSCKAFARAFSCVRTKLARCYDAKVCQSHPDVKVESRK